jgi:hypothetical protein
VDKDYRPLANKENDFLFDRERQRTYNFSGIIATGNQDMAVQVSMGSITDRTEEYLGVTDVGIIEMRKLLVSAAKDLCEGKKPAEAVSAEAFEGVCGSSFVRPSSVSFEECVNEAMRRIERTKQKLRSLSAAK